MSSYAEQRHRRQAGGDSVLLAITFMLLMWLFYGIVCFSLPKRNRR